jgi:hypothetical protein
MILFMIFRKHLKQSQSDTRVEKSQAVGIICLLEKKEPVHLRRLFFERGG